jgi:hypothetical protein
VPGYEGLYRVSDHGRVMSLPRTTTKGGLLKPGPGRYLTVALHRNDRGRTFGIHKVVLLSFVGPCPPGLLIRHLDGNSHNNRLSNLCYGTNAENGQDQMRHGTFARGSRQGLAKLTEADIPLIRSRYAAGDRQLILAREFGVSQCTIGQVVRGVTWTHV